VAVRTLDAMPALESLPSKIGPYRIVEKIGEGGMGVVYLARDAESRQVAVKVLGATVARDPNARARLAREVDTMRRVQSPYVAEIVDADISGKSPYIVTRYVPGQTLEDAESAIAGKGLQFRVTQTSDDKVHAGNAIKTSPAAGEKVKKDQVVTIFVSTGPPVIDLPQFDPGTPVAQVDTKLKSLGLKVSHNEEFSDSVPKNGLITLAPSDQAVKFSTIVVTVSKGPRMVTIPDIAQFSPASDAKAQLESLGLVVNLQPVAGARQDPVVLQMNPGSGERVEVGSTVTLTVF